ncbi:hypothetical protein EHE19_006870 [Ruminiclostridium herbifermentans]|uniref:DUF3999 family protein n=1 Tax=Ruminiclostridium herbifermentans TaxID=2488810 RepID=A0A4U7JP29_9FIRM|nr:hypothetical protein [Ruminiclostridium herbifermentans]QNU68146.1 hypothetical protein EHE19_006870 [Ruminiclostridium herbifermentans]
MIKRIIASAVILLMLSFTGIYAIDFSYSASIENSGNKKYKAIRLTSEIYNNIQGNMADLELYSKENEPIPYFINSSEESDSIINAIYEMNEINSYVKDNYFYFDYTLKMPQDEDVTASSIKVETENKNFAKEVEIFGSYDNVKWEKVQEDIIYNVDGNRKLEIAFDGIKKYTHYRFKISNNLEKISFTKVTLEHNNVIQEQEYFSNTIEPKFTTEESDSKTVVKISNLKNLKLSSITLKTDSRFKRLVTFNGFESKMLYNLEFENTKYKDLTIPLGQYRVTEDTAEIIISNQDDKPLEILGIEVKYLVDELVFDGSAADEYILKYGNSESKEPKNYDISNYKEQILKEGYDVLSIKEIKKENSNDNNEQQLDLKLIFNIVLCAIAVVLGIIIIRKLKK